jgi:hypothetical protein
MIHHIKIIVAVLGIILTLFKTNYLIIYGDFVSIIYCVFSLVLKSYSSKEKLLEMLNVILQLFFSFFGNMLLYYPVKVHFFLNFVCSVMLEVCILNIGKEYLTSLFFFYAILFFLFGIVLYGWLVFLRVFG